MATALFLVHEQPALREQLVVLEKEHYPRQKICAGAIGARADKLLASIGVVVDVPSAPIRELSVRTQAGESSARIAHLGRVIRRVEFDHALAREARARGIRVLEGAKVHGVAPGSARVELQTSLGPLSADVVVGADGVGGFIRRSLGLGPGRLRAQVIEVDTEPVPSDRARDALHFDFFSRDFTGYAWDFPTIVDGQPLVCRGVYHLKLTEQKFDIAQLLGDRLRARGLDPERYRVKRYAERGFESSQLFAAPRVLLVGEAAGIDALTGEGIPQAIEYGALAGRYLVAKLAKTDLTFRDWNAQFARAEPGRSLRWREKQMHDFFGSRRAFYERHIVHLPSFTQVSAEHMAGLPLSKGLFWRDLAAHAWKCLTRRSRA
jgi:flavin-dependent dehydrogenase